ncbi:MAG: hypothetical protein WBZ48_02630 [Bacteroidota bacterium]
MKTGHAEKVIGLFILLPFFFGGCYTVLMDPAMLMSSEGENADTTFSHSGSAPEVSYNNNYLSSPGQAGLNAGQPDMQNSGLMTGRDATIDLYGWQAPDASLPWWYEEFAPAPPTALGLTSPSIMIGNGPRRRTIGTTRGADRSSSDIQASTSIITTTVNTISTPIPPTATGTSNSTTTDRSRTSFNNSATSTLRKTGSNRGGGKE